MFTISDANPWPPIRCDYIDCRLKSCDVVISFKNDPATIGGVTTLPQVVGWVSTNQLCLPFRV